MLSNTSGVIGNTPRVFKNTFGVITQADIVAIPALLIFFS